MALRWIGRALRGILIGVLFALCAALFYVIVIMGDTTEGASAPEAVATGAPLAAMPQPRLSLAVNALSQAAYYFNAPLMTLPASSGWTLKEIYVSDDAPEGAGGTVREVRLRYTDGSGTATLDVSSLTPSRCLRALPGRGFLAATDQDWTLAGRAAVLMSDGATLHLHMQNGETVYQLEGLIDAATLRKAAQAAQVWGE